LLGSNGAGKSTRSRCSPLFCAIFGEARVGGFSITTSQSRFVAHRYVRRRFLSTVAYRLREPAHLCKLYDIPAASNKPHREQLTFVDLSADAGRLVSQYSGAWSAARDCPGHVASATCAVFDERLLGLTIARTQSGTLIDLRDNTAHSFPDTIT